MLFVNFFNLPGPQKKDARVTDILSRLFLLNVITSCLTFGQVEGILPGREQFNASVTLKLF
jgi:hypothetical protein